MLKVGHVVVSLRNVEGCSCSKSCCIEMLKFGHGEVLLLRNAAGRFCSIFLVKKC